MRNANLDLSGPKTPGYEISDPARISGYMSNAFRPNKSIVRRRVDCVGFQHRSLRFGGSSINQVRYGVEARVEAPPANDIYLAMFTVAGTARVDQGNRVFETHPGSFCVLNPSRHLNVDLSHDFEQLTVKLRGDSLRRSFWQLAHHDIDQPLEFEPRVYPMAGPAASFGRLINGICEDLSDSNPGFSQQLVCEHIEEALLALFLTGFSHNHSDLIGVAESNLSPYFLKHAEEYIHTHLGEPIGLTELAEVSGVSIRSLQSAFKRFRNTTPTEYIRNLRLDQARQALREPANRQRSITEIASTLGFTHLSKFADYYKRRFGQTPSATRSGSSD